MKINIFEGMNLFEASFLFTLLVVLIYLLLSKFIDFLDFLITEISEMVRICGKKN